MPCFPISKENSQPLFSPYKDFIILNSNMQLPTNSGEYIKLGWCGFFPLVSSLATSQTEASPEKVVGLGPAWWVLILSTSKLLNVWNISFHSSISYLARGLYKLWVHGLATNWLNLNWNLNTVYIWIRFNYACGG